MKRLVILTSVCLFVFFAGCKKYAKENTDLSRFPDFLVGTWESDDDRWAFTFEADGSISSMRHCFVTVPIDIQEGGAYEQGREGAHSTYVLGPCVANYDSAEHKLTVEINIDYFEVVLPVGTFEGNMRDYFEGEVFADELVYSAKWTNYAELVGAEKPDPNTLTAEKIVFRRIEQ